MADMNEETRLRGEIAGLKAALAKSERFREEYLDETTRLREELAEARRLWGEDIDRLAEARSDAKEALDFWERANEYAQILAPKLRAETARATAAESTLADAQRREAKYAEDANRRAGMFVDIASGLYGQPTADQLCDWAALPALAAETRKQRDEARAALAEARGEAAQALAALGCGDQEKPCGTCRACLADALQGAARDMLREAIDEGEVDCEPYSVCTLCGEDMMEGRPHDPTRACGQLDAALARAGEQETPAASWCGKPGCAEHAAQPAGEPASSGQEVAGSDDDPLFVRRTAHGLVQVDTPQWWRDAEADAMRSRIVELEKHLATVTGDPAWTTKAPAKGPPTPPPGEQGSDSTKEEAHEPRDERIRADPRRAGEGATREEGLAGVPGRGGIRAERREDGGAEDHAQGRAAAAGETVATGEQGKGGGEGLRSCIGYWWEGGYDAALEDLKAGHSGAQRSAWCTAAKHSAYCPAQPAEHPASGGEEK